MFYPRLLIIFLIQLADEVIILKMNIKADCKKLLLISWRVCWAVDAAQLLELCQSQSAAPVSESEQEQAEKWAQAARAAPDLSLCPPGRPRAALGTAQVLAG